MGIEAIAAARVLENFMGGLTSAQKEKRSEAAEAKKVLLDYMMKTEQAKRQYPYPKELVEGTKGMTPEELQTVTTFMGRKSPEEISAGARRDIGAGEESIAGAHKKESEVGVEADKVGLEQEKMARQFLKERAEETRQALQTDDKYLEKIQAAYEALDPLDRQALENFKKGPFTEDRAKKMAELYQDATRRGDSPMLDALAYWLQTSPNYSEFLKPQVTTQGSMTDTIREFMRGLGGGGETQ